MRLILHLYPIRHDAASLMTAAALLPGCVTGKQNDLATEIDTPGLHELMQLGEASGGFGVSAEWIVSEAETALISHFSVVCRQTVPESDAAYKRNHDLWAATPMTQAGGENPIRLVRGFCLSHAQLKSQTVAGIGEWTEAYVAGPEVWRAFEQAGMTGVVPEKILHVRSGKPFPDAHQLFAETSLPPLERDAARNPMPESGGLLCYRSNQLAGLPDFMHTAEPCANARFGWPLWVVSARVRELFREGTLRGWAFHPVLTVDSALHRDYLTLCGKLQALLSTTRYSRLEARSW